jgi:hypothetical protein
MSEGDSYLIIGEVTGVVSGQVLKIFHDGKKVKLGKKGQIITFQTSQKARAGDRVYVIEKV